LVFALQNADNPYEKDIRKVKGEIFLNIPHGFSLIICECYNLLIEEEDSMIYLYNRKPKENLNKLNQKSRKKSQLTN
jgi:hypothetical protein